MAATVWKGFLTFGLVSLPVRLYRAARAERVRLRQIARRVNGNPHRSDDAEIGSAETIDSTDNQAWVRARGSLEPSEFRDEHNPHSSAPAQISKGFEYRQEQFVELNADELKSLAAPRSSEMVIDEFVALSEIDPVFFETSYYLVPEDVGEKAYALLFRFLQQSQLVALTNLAMHGREHMVVIRSGRTGLLAHTMFYLNEVHPEGEFIADPSLATPAETKLAIRLIASLTTTFNPSRYADRYRARLQTLIDGKMQSQSSRAIPIRSAQAQVVDISHALRQSLKNLKKPATGESPALAKRVAKKTRTLRQTAG